MSAKVPADRVKVLADAVNKVLDGDEWKAFCAQTYTYVPDSAPGAGSNNIWPFNMSSTTGRFIQILDAKYLTGAPVKFTEVAFTRYSSSGPTTFDVKQFQMRMSHTTTSSTSALSPPTPTITNPA